MKRRPVSKGLGTRTGHGGRVVGGGHDCAYRLAPHKSTPPRIHPRSHTHTHANPTSSQHQHPLCLRLRLRLRQQQTPPPLQTLFCSSCLASLAECSGCLMPHCKATGDLESDCLLPCEGKPGCLEVRAVPCSTVRRRRRRRGGGWGVVDGRSHHSCILCTGRTLLFLSCSGSSAVLAWLVDFWCHAVLLLMPKISIVSMRNRLF